MDVNRRKGCLLTGATGFLGGYILMELLRNTAVPVYCLVRASDGSSARQRVMDNLSYLFGKEEVEKWNGERIIAFNGGLTKTYLGLPKDFYEKLKDRVDTIFHAAAMMSHFGKLEDFRKVNVTGTQRLVDFAKTNEHKVINYISTLAVSGRHTDNPQNLFRETDFHEKLECPNPYVQTKYEAEKMLRETMQKGAPVRIFRPGFVMGDSKTGRFKKDIETDAQHLHLKGHILMQVAPPRHDEDYMDITPVDYAAAAIVYISLDQSTLNKTFHICNPHPILKYRIWEMIRDYGYKLRILPPDNYKEDIFLVDDSEDYLRGLQNVIAYLDDYEKSPAVFDASNTLRCLQGSEIECPKPDKRLLGKYLDYCVSVAFLPQPKSEKGGRGEA